LSSFKKISIFHSLFFVLLITLNANSQVTGQRTFSYGGKTFGTQVTIQLPGQGYIVLANSNNNFPLTNTTASDSNSIIMLRVSKTFDTIWSKRITQFIMADAILLQDGNIAIIGSPYRGINTRQGIDLSIIKINNSGNILVQKSYNIGFRDFISDRLEYPNPLASIVELKTGQLFVLLYNAGYVFRSQSIFMRLNKTLDLLFSKTSTIDIYNYDDYRYKIFLLGKLSINVIDSNRLSISNSSRRIYYSVDDYKQIIEVDTNMNMLLHKRLTDTFKQVTSFFWNPTNNSYFATGNYLEDNKIYDAYSIINFAAGNTFRSISIRNLFKASTSQNTTLEKSFFLNNSFYIINNAFNFFYYNLNTLSSIIDSASNNFRFRILKVNPDLTVSWYKRLHSFGFTYPVSTYKPFSFTEYTPATSGISLTLQGSKIVLVSNKIPGIFSNVGTIVPIDITKKETGIFVTQFDTSGFSGNCNLTEEKYEITEDSIHFADLPFFAYADKTFDETSTSYAIEPLPVINISDTCLPLKKPASLFSFYPGGVSTGLSDSIVCNETPIYLYEYSYNEPKDWHWIFPPEADLSTADSSNFPDLTNVKFTSTGNFPIKLVTKNAAGNDTLTKYITVINFIPQPNIGNDTLLCEGDSLLIIYRDPPNSKHYFSSTDVPGVFTESDTLVIKQMGEYICAAYTNCGYKYDTLQVKFITSPEAKFTFTDTCGNLSVQFMDSSRLNNNQSLAYQWAYAPINSNSFTNFSTDQNPVFTFPVYNSFKVRLIVADIQACGFADTLVQNIVLLPKPVAAFTATNICGSRQVSFNNSSSNLSDNNYTSQFYFGNGQSSTDRNPVVSYAAYDSFLVKLLVTSSQGCSSDTVGLIVTVKDKPSANIVYQNNACDNRVFTLNSNAGVQDANISQYQWLLPNGNRVTTANFNQQLPAGSYTFKHWAVSSTGCSSDTISKLITVDIIPVIALELANGCVGKPVTFSAQTLTGTTASSKWFFGNGDSSNLSTPGYTYLQPGNFNISYTASSSNGCRSNVATKNIVIETNPVVSFTIDELCAGKRINFVSTATNIAGNITSYNWAFGNDSTAAIPVTITTFRRPGNYRITLTATTLNGCTTTAIQNLIIPNLSVNAGNDVTINQNTPYQLQGSGTGSYLWQPAQFLNNATIANPVALLQKDQLFTLQLTAGNGCKGFDSVLIKVLGNIFIPTAFSPNGDSNNDVWRIQRLADYPSAKLSVFNRYGQIIFEGNNNNGYAWDGKHKGKLQPTGAYVYVLQVNDGKSNQTFKGTVMLVR